MLVATELKELEAVLPSTCPLRRLKAAMRSAAELIAAQSPETAPDPLTEVMQVLRRIDRQGLQDLPGLLASRPRLT